MWISRLSYDDLRDKALKADAALLELRTYNIQLNATFDWMKLRLYQVEHERAQLIENYMGVKITVPTIEPAPPVSLSDVLGETVSFADIGDEEAAKQGANWNELGELVHGKK